MSASSWASFAGHLRHRRRARQRGGMRTLGVTLVELMIAVALVGLLAAIAVPSYES